MNYPGDKMSTAEWVDEIVTECSPAHRRAVLEALAAHLDAEVAPAGYVATRYDRPGWQVAKDESGLQLGWWAYQMIEDEDGNPRRNWLGSINLHDGFASAQAAADAVSALAEEGE